MIIATYLVKNDADILRESIEYHLNHGVDALIVTENNSCEETIEIFNSFRDVILCRFNEKGNDYKQGEWVTRMARVASGYSPNWIFHSDADEFWTNLSCLYTQTERFVQTNTWMNYLPYSFDEFEINKCKFFERPYDESFFGIGMQDKRKVVHRPDPHITIAQGSHQIIGNDGLFGVPINIKHYPIRTYSQFENKVIEGGAAYERSNLPPNIGTQWRRWYRDYKEGKLREVFASFLATPENLRYHLLRRTIQSDALET